MIILNGGEIVKCTNITFSDNNKYDMEGGHPAVVLLPTSEKEDFVYCIYMTSDESRAIRESEKYKEFKTKKTKLKSFINLDQILKRANNKDVLVDSIEEDVFISLLESFYKFQISKEEANPEFLEIRSKIETLLLMLKNKDSFGIRDKISREELERFDKISNATKKIKEIKNKNNNRIWIFNYALKIIEQGKSENDLDFKNEKDKKYFSTLLNLYNKIGKINLEKIDLNNPNNELRNIYCDFRNKYFLINIDNLFTDLNDLFYILGNNNNIITDFIILEEQKNLEKNQKKLDKQEHKKHKQKEEQNLKRQQRIKAFKEFNTSKYGNWSGFDEK